MSLDDEIESAYAGFDKGVPEGTSEPPHPCGQWFIDNLVFDLSIWLDTLALRMPALDSMDQELNDEAWRAFKHIGNIMDEYHRLQKYPILYPSAESQAKFTAEVKKMFSGMSRLMERVALLSEEAVRAVENHELPVRARKVDGIWFRLPEPVNAELPPFHPKYPDNKKPWNRVFDNLDNSHATIRQMFTPSASQMLSTTKFMHRTVQRSYRKANRIVRNWQNTMQLVEATGENHEILGVLEESRRREKLEFPTDGKLVAYEKGKLSLSGVSTVLMDFSRRRRSNHRRQLLMRTIVRG